MHNSDTLSHLPDAKRIGRETAVPSVVEIGRARAAVRTALERRGVSLHVIAHGSALLEDLQDAMDRSASALSVDLGQDARSMEHDMIADPDVVAAVIELQRFVERLADLPAPERAPSGNSPFPEFSDN